MPTHEHFEELSALAAIGQLTAKEQDDLLEHLRGCDSCRRASDEFAAILGQLPSADPHDVAGEMEEVLAASHRGKFLEKAATQGIRFTEEVTGTRRNASHGSFVPKNKWISFAFGGAFATLLILVALIVRPQFRRIHQGSVVASTPVFSGTTGLPAARHESAPTSEAIPPRKLVIEKTSDRQVRALKEQLAAVVEKKDQLQKDYEHAEKALETQKTQSDGSKSTISQQSAELEKLKNDQAQMIAALVAKEDQIRELNDQLATQKSLVEREQQLNAAAKDVRELMAARNLHLVDVFDFDTRGKRDKSFGRVYYIENKKLIFYAFDLGERGSSSKVSFQAWAQRGTENAKPRNLGTFYIDDHAQKRWVLRVDDPKLLSSIESVFVTVEPSPGRDLPSGRRILFAYLGTRPNHP